MDVFIADLHLKPDDTKNNLFLAMCKYLKNNCNNLFILGDFFDLWLGDDVSTYQYPTIIEALKNLSNTPNIHFMIGNRDFLVSSEFAKKTNCKIIDEPYIFNNYVLMHGDSLCTDDISYQQFKKVVRSSEWQENFLSKTAKERTSIAYDIRAHSKASVAKKDSLITDVNKNEVNNFMQKFANFDLIHGHTHRRCIHNHNTFKRIVLGDWQQNSGNMIKLSNDKLTWLDLTINSANHLEVVESEAI